MSTARRAARIATVALGVFAADHCYAQDWEPFKEQDERARRQARSQVERQDSGVAKRPRAVPNRSFVPDEVTSGSLPALGASAAPIERSATTHVSAADDGKFGSNLWQGLDTSAIEAHMARIELPIRSPVLLGLWKRMWTAPAIPTGDNDQLTALQLETLYRWGLIESLRSQLGSLDGAHGVATVAMAARAHIGLGDRERGCSKIRGVVRQISGLPKLARADALLISGYCALFDSNTSAASVAAELVRDQKTGASTSLTVLEALAAGGKPHASLPGAISLMDYRFLEVSGIAEPAAIVDRADGPLLAALATDPGLDAGVRIRAIEAPGQPNAFDPDLLTEVYRLAHFDAALLADPARAQVQAHMKSALLFKAAEAERRPAEKVQLAKALIEEAQRTGRLLPTAAALGPLLGDIRPNAELDWLGQTAIQILLAAGRYDRARAWAERTKTAHWLVLADIAAPRGRDAAQWDTIANLTTSGKVPNNLLHRLTTVLDALDVQVPISLWEAASRLPQPAGGHLPETGVLSQLQEAAKQKQVARTILLTMRAIGPNGPGSAHMISLGDAIKALRRVGLEREARRLAFEALFGEWPQIASRDR